MYKIDKQKFKSVFPNCKNYDELCDLFNIILNEAGINTKERICMFLAQCGHESGGFTRFSENLNYSYKGLRAVFGKYFKTEEEAKKYERKPEKIANKVYANRMGNSSEESGDGWKYRGRGILQVTGKINYLAFSKDMNIDISNPDVVAEDLSIAIKSAIWFWNKNNLNKYADNKDINGCTKRINGGYNGLEDRIKKYNMLIS